MANKDIFAPPSKEELDNTQLFAPPTEEELKSNQEPEDYSQLESLGLGAASGISLGFSDEAEAAIRRTPSKLEELLSGSEPKKGETYEDLISQIRERYHKAEEENPMSYLGGNILGGIAIPIPGAGIKSATTLGKVGLSAARGAGAGAVAGLGASEGETAGDITKDVLGGTLLGGALGGATEGIMQGGKALISKGAKVAADVMPDEATILKKAYQMGKEGIDTSTDATEARLQNKAEEVLSDLKSNKALKGKAIEDVVSIAEDLKGPSGTKIQDLIGQVDNALKDTSLSDDSKQKILKLKELLTLTGKPTAEGFANESISPTIARDIYKKAGAEFGSLSDRDVGSDLVRKMKEQLKGEIAQGEKPIEQAYEKSLSEYSSLMKASETLGLDSPDDAKKVRHILSRLTNLKKAEGSGDTRQAFKEAIEDLSKSNPDLARKMQTELPEFSTQQHVASLISNKPLGGADRSVLSKAIGYTQSKGLMATKYAGKVASRLEKFTPENLATLQQTHPLSASTLNVLSSIATKPLAARKALIFATMQNPAYREELNGIFQEGED